MALLAKAEANVGDADILRPPELLICGYKALRPKWLPEGVGAPLGIVRILLNVIQPIAHRSVDGRYVLWRPC